MKKFFEKYIDSKEPIIGVFKPDKMRFVWIKVIIGAIIGVLIGVPLIVVGLVVQFPLDKPADPELNAGWVLFVLGLIALCLTPSLLLIIWQDRYSKTVYAYTANRLIIRTGFIDVDYHTVMYESIETIEKHVGLLDAIARRGTGSIFFGIPYDLQEGYHRDPDKGPLKFYSFKNIENPDRVYHEIKALMSREDFRK